MQKFKILPPTYILSPLNCFSKKRLFEELCLVASPFTEVSDKDLLVALNAREAGGSTVCANEVGIPHTMLKDIESSVAVLAILPQPISYQTIDTDYEGVDIAFAFFLSNKDDYAKNKEMLFQLYELFENPDLVNSLRRSWQDSSKLHQILFKIDELLDNIINPKAKIATNKSNDILEEEEAEEQKADSSNLDALSTGGLEDITPINHESTNQI